MWERTDGGGKEARCRLVKLLPAHRNAPIANHEESATHNSMAAGVEASTHRSRSTEKSSPPMMGSSRKYSRSRSLYVADLERTTGSIHNTLHANPGMAGRNGELTV